MNITLLSATSLRQAIRDRSLSPVEILEAFITRMEAVNPGINALAATDFERARAAARSAERQVLRGEALGLLHGLPIGIKDLQDTQGLLTTNGSVHFRGNVPLSDCSLVARLKQAGAIVAAKTNVPEMGAGANTRNAVWGATGNPFNPTLNAGGSSGGSAAALATNMLPLCTGSDTGGSLRIPAALCGVVGMRTSPGLIANNQRALGWSVLSVLGPMARSVDDCALLLAASVGSMPLDPLSFDASPAEFFPLPAVELQQLRIGYTEDFGHCAVDQEMREVFRHRIAGLSKLVSRCEPVSLDLPRFDEAFDVLRAEAFLAAFTRTFEEDPESLGANIRANMEIAQRLSLAARAQAHLTQTRLAQSFAAAFSDYDLLISPSTSLTPFPWTQLYASTVDGIVMQNYYQWLALSYSVTLSTHPALSLPCGVDQHGMPFGLQLIGPLRRDARLLSIAQAIEQAFATQPEYCRPVPNLKAPMQADPQLTSIVTHPALFDSTTPTAGPSAPV